MQISHNLQETRNRIAKLREQRSASLQPSFMASLKDTEQRLDQAMETLYKAEVDEKAALDVFIEQSPMWMFLKTQN